MTRTMGFMRGMSGRGLVSTAFSATQGITLTFTDGTTWSTGPLGSGGGGAGPAGRGISNAVYNPATGVVTVTFTDATTFTTGDLRGADGDDANLPTGSAGQVLGYGAGGAPVAMNLPAAPDWTSLDGKPGSFPPAADTHGVADVTSLQAALDGKSATTHTHIWGDVTGKPVAFPPAAHGHEVDDVNGLEIALSGLSARQNNWIGTQAEYDALPAPQRADPTITHLVTD